MLGRPPLWVPDRRVVTSPGGGGTQNLAVDNLLWGPGTGIAPTGEGSAFSLNDADNAIGGVTTLPPKTAGVTITHVGLWVKAITGNPPAYNVGLVTVDANGNPTTAAYGGAVNPTYDFTATGWVWVPLTTPATPTTGDVVAGCIWPTASAPDGSNFVQTCQNFGSPNGNQRLPHARLYTTAWITGTALPPVGLKFSDGSTAIPSISSPTQAFQSDDTPDEYGGVFTLPFNAVCEGAFACMAPGSVLVDPTLNLYDSANTLLCSKLTDSTQAAWSASVGYMAFVRWTAQSLAANTTYRLSATNNSASSNLVLSYATVAEAESRHFWPEGRRWQGTTRTDGGAWANNPLAVPMMGLILSQITVPA